ncbi:ATP-binding protein [Aeoliella mucimassa]|uniref:Serine-protein kinase RsbW n=1 Tax=Aeoliella mucimassa TaxID=2527972 RepID=A0A518AV09_9BACT|nr:ATP-binding protein [Aeoliella mucimassa]QDU58550.1 Serine-protein kinase RsbW [Aeoliella mucimassa]
MTQHNWSWTIERSLPSKRNAHLEVMEAILAKLTELGWSDHELFGVQMALEESLTNAIRHGNKYDESKKVQVECKVSAERFWLKVQDEGPGFKLEKVPDCTHAENLEACGGRGVMLIQAYMTTVEYNGCGNQVVMEKIRGAGADDLVDV